MRAVNLMSDFINLPQISRASMRKTGKGKTMLTGLRRGITLRSQRWDMEIWPSSLDPSKAKLGSNYQVI